MNFIDTSQLTKDPRLKKKGGMEEKKKDIQNYKKLKQEYEQLH